MTVVAFTDYDLSGTGIGPDHGGAMTKLNEIVTQCNANETALGGASNPFNYVGTIALAASFPTSAVVTVGDVYKITADVEDDDATKTNTGQTFLAGSDIYWNGTGWEDLGRIESTGIVTVAATPYTVAAGVHTVLVDTTTIAAPSTINLPALTVERASRQITVIDYSSGAGTDNISVTPDGTDEIDNVNAAKDITINSGALSVITDGVGWFTSGATAHAQGDGSDHADVATNTVHITADGTGHANVVLNDTHRASDGTNHANVVLNDTHRASAGTDHANVVTNDTHVAGDGSDHADVATNTVHITADGTGHANVVLNDTHRASAGIDHSYIQDNIVDAVIAVANAAGGTTTSALTADIQDLAASGLSKTCVFRIVCSDSEYGGSDDANANVTFSAATLGSILASGSGYAIVKSDASGNFACTANNAVDETVYFSCATHTGGTDALANGVLVRGCVPDGATWS